jgi:DNA-binding MarR family transcriptional regulator
VSRQEDSEDRRRTLIFVTPSGRQTGKPPATRQSEHLIEWLSRLRADLEALMQGIKHSPGAAARNAMMHITGRRRLGQSTTTRRPDSLAAIDLVETLGWS